MQELNATEPGVVWTATLARGWKVCLAAPLLCGALSYAGSFALTPLFTARTSLIPPQQQQSAATAALASISGLVGLGGGGGAALRSPVDQFVALMESRTIQDRLIERFNLQAVYGEQFKADTRKELSKMTRIAVGKRDGLISVEVDDKDPGRAAALSNAYVEELRRLTSTLAVSEAQQRRVFFEGLLKATRSSLEVAQQALEQTGVSASTLRSEPKAAAEIYGKLQAQVTAAEVRLQALRSRLTEESAEVQLQGAELNALRSRLATLEGNQPKLSNADYIGKYREFKYQETLFDLFARQYELARVDESREGALIQVIDTAAPAEKRSWPRRSFIALAGVVVGLMLGPALLLTRSEVSKQRAPRRDP